MKLTSFAALSVFVAACGGEVAPADAVGPSTATAPTEPNGPRETKSADPRAPLAVLSKGCSAPSKVGSFEKSVNVDGGERTFSMSVPPSDSNDARSLVIVLHDAGSDSTKAREAFAIEASMPRSIFVYPQANGAWDATGENDLAFFDAIATTVGDEQCLVQNRIFVSGVGAGADLAHHVGCQRSSSVRAIASIGGTGPKTVRCRGSVAVWETNDADVAAQSDAGRASFEHWLRQNRCTGAKASGACLEGEGCYAAFPVTYCETKGMGTSVPTFAPLQVATFFARFNGDSILE